MHWIKVLLLLVVVSGLSLPAQAKSQNLAKWQKTYPGLELFSSSSASYCLERYPNSIAVVRHPNPSRAGHWLYGLTTTSGDIPQWGKHLFLIPPADQEIHLATPGCSVMVKATGESRFSLYQVESAKKLKKIGETAYTHIQPYHSSTAGVFVAAYEEEPGHGYRVELVESTTTRVMLNIPFVQPFAEGWFVRSLPELRDDWAHYQRSWLWYLEVQHTGGNRNIIATELNASATTRYITRAYLTEDDNVPFVQNVQEHGNSGSLIRIAFNPVETGQERHYQPSLSRGFSEQEEPLPIPGNGQVIGFRILDNAFPGGYLTYENTRDFLVQRGVEQKHRTLVQVKHPDGQVLWHTLKATAIEEEGWREMYAFSSLEYAGQDANGTWRIWGGPFPNPERDTGSSLEEIFAKRHEDDIRQAADAEKRRQEQAAYEARMERVHAMQAAQRAQDEAVIQRHIQQQQRELAARRELSNAINGITSSLVNSASQVTTNTKNDCVNQGVRDSRFDNTGAGYNSYTKALERCIEKKLREQ